jgi:hypothetical protein
MLDGDGFADELVALLGDEEPVGLACDEVASRLHRRRADVLATLRGDPRVRRTGRGRGSRWRVTAPIPPGRTGTDTGGAEGGAGYRQPAPPGASARQAASESPTT